MKNTLAVLLQIEIKANLYISLFICLFCENFTLSCQKLANAFKGIQTVDRDVYTNTVFHTGLLITG